MVGLNKTKSVERYGDDEAKCDLTWRCLLSDTVYVAACPVICLSLYTRNSILRATASKLHTDIAISFEYCFPFGFIAPHQSPFLSID